MTTLFTLFKKIVEETRCLCRQCFCLVKPPLEIVIVMGFFLSSHLIGVFVTRRALRQFTARVVFRSPFRTQTNIYDRAFNEKRVR